MSIKLGNLDISKLMLGSNEADKIYFGSTEVYSSGPDYLCFEAVENTNISFAINGTLSTVPTIQYSLNKRDWTNYTFGNNISLTIGQKCFWKGDNNSFSQSNSKYIKFTSTGLVEASGNIMSLLDSTCQSVTIPTDYCFAHLFRQCANLLTAPSLPATTLANNCYYQMFNGCTSLTTGPSLPATTLVATCYYQMFYGCTSLYVSDTQTSEATHEWHIPTSGTFKNRTSRNQTNMFDSCLGSRSSDDMSGAFGESHTYYTQNAPIE